MTRCPACPRHAEACRWHAHSREAKGPAMRGQSGHRLPREYWPPSPKDATDHGSHRRQGVESRASSGSRSKSLVPSGRACAGRRREAAGCWGRLYGSTSRAPPLPLDERDPDLYTARHDALHHQHHRSASRKGLGPSAARMTPRRRAWAMGASHPPSLLRGDERYLWHAPPPRRRMKGGGQIRCH